MNRCLVVALLLSVSLFGPPGANAQPLPDETPPPTANAVTDACARFGDALRLAASNYDEFAYATAGEGDIIDYSDQNVWRTNIIGRTALREAAHSALLASRTPGLAPEVSDAMRAWSLHAAKLVVVMGLRGGGDFLNETATELNTDAHNAHMACARNGGQA